MKSTKTSFTIENNSGSEMIIVHEPEGFEFNLQVKDKVLIEADSGIETLNLSTFIDDGKVGISIWEGDRCDYRVLHDGVDVFKKYFD